MTATNTNSPAIAGIKYMSETDCVGGSVGAIVGVDGSALNAVTALDG